MTKHSINSIIKIVFLGFTLLTLSPLMAELIQPEQAKQAARTYLSEISEAKHLNLRGAQAHTYTNGSLCPVSNQQMPDPATSLYLIMFEDANYVLLSADDNAYPILAYSDEGMTNVSDLPPAFYWWMDNYSKYVNQIRNDKSALTANKDMWNSLISGSYLNAAKHNRSVVPLLSTMWNQDWPYNALCPADPAGPGGRVYAGCVATAMGMVMKYWNHPQTGTGNHSYYAPGYGYQTANFGNTTYLWDEMLDSIGTDYLPIATFLYHCGVSVNMGYAPDGSGAQSTDAAEAMVDYFNYPTAQFVSRDSYNQTTWNALMTDQIDNGSPVYYSGHSEGGGHAFVLDGYDVANSFHFNFGWGGSSNGYFNTSNINGFTDWQGAIINSIPANYNIANIPVKLVASNTTVGDNFNLSIKTNPLLGSWNINHYDLQLYFDDNNVEFVGYNIDNTISQAGIVSVAETAPGVITVIWNNSAILTGGGTLINFTFRASDVGDYLFDLLSMNYNTTPVTNSSFVMVNAAAPVANIVDSQISLTNIMHLGYQQIGVTELKTTYLLPSWNTFVYHCNVNYDPNKLEFVGYENTDTISSDCTITIDYETAGVVNLNCNSSQVLTGAGALLKLKFRAVGNIGGISVTQLSISDFVYSNGTTNITIPNTGTANVILSSHTANQDELAVVSPILQVYPNPARGLVNLKFASQSIAPASFSIYNLKGQLVKKIVATNSDKSNLEWDSRDERGQAVSTGIYFINWQQGENKGYGKVLIIK